MREVGVSFARRRRLRVLLLVLFLLILHLLKLSLHFRMDLPSRMRRVRSLVALSNFHLDATPLHPLDRRRRLDLRCLSLPLALPLALSLDQSLNAVYIVDREVSLFHEDGELSASDQLRSIDLEDGLLECFLARGLPQVCPLRSLDVLVLQLVVVSDDQVLVEDQMHTSSFLLRTIELTPHLSRVAIRTDTRRIKRRREQPLDFVLAEFCFLL
uniref:Uncharacterized protein n=1 Tax=Strombidium inclinatum TaxID=197538 RepID=A0A7S3IVF8_9SPIT|mmetsp:Transcript_38336/g.58420  ORF Transcript_38336/g.58420 Transcript_38336/m.58420 type:complete len:213 (+) Transcript_38336:644-1282(+)